MSDKALSRAELELTQRIQMHFPRGVISPQTLGYWNSCPTKVLTARLEKSFSAMPLFFVVATTSLDAIAGTPCIITTLAFSREWTFTEVAAEILGVNASTDIIVLGNSLIEHRHTMSEAQAEKMMKKTDHGEKTGLTFKYTNLFFKETGNPKNPVSLGCVYRGERDWIAGVRRLAYAYRGDAGYRLLVRNLDASKL